MKILSLALDMILILLVSEVVKRLEIFVNFVLYSLHLDLVKIRLILKHQLNGIQWVLHC